MTKIIGDLGVNHNGDFDLLIELADMAMKTGIDAVKLQLRTPTICVPKDQWEIPRQWFDGSIVSYIDYKEMMEFSIEQLELFDNHMEANYGLDKWWASVWDIPSLKKLLGFDVPYIKIPSAMLTNHSLIKKAIKSGIPIILSTGMSTEEEIDDAVLLFDNDYPLTILACHSAYPTPDDEINLKTIDLLKWKYVEWKEKEKNNTKVGFSSHSKSPYPSIYSAVLGAEMIEVHVTLDRTMQGTDHAASLEKSGLELLVREVRRIPTLMGNGKLQVYDSEKSAREKLRG